MPVTEAPTGPTRLTRRHALISGFILFHCVAIACYALPIDSLLVGDIKDLLRPYLSSVGLIQNWAMFAPEPLSLNVYVEAQITYRSGRTVEWMFPRPQDFGYAERYLKERQRKFVSDALRLDVYAALWPGAARYVARLNNTDPTNPPVAVKFIRHWSKILLPEPGQPHKQEPEHSYAFFTYAVTPEDLR
jgi:hypothetical protein